jgi:hypothetical protein
MWIRIYAANRDVVSDPNALRYGMSLTIPLSHRRFPGCFVESGWGEVLFSVDLLPRNGQEAFLRQQRPQHLLFHIALGFKG